MCQKSGPQSERNTSDSAVVNAVRATANQRPSPLKHKYPHNPDYWQAL
jgi:hypothetical protein